MFINIPKGEIYFCDSFGKDPIGNIKTIIKRFMDYYQKKFGKSASYKYNKKSYQKDRSECGIYSSNFIIRLLSGENFDDIIKNPLDFKEINACRNVYFSNKASKYTPTKKCDPAFLN